MADNDLKVFTDKLQEFKRKNPDIPVDPVDAFGGYVAVDKYAKDNLSETQENIRWKTQLDPGYEGEVSEE